MPHSSTRSVINYGYVLLVAITYFFAGKLGLLLAIPPGSYTTLFWPPSGVALAALLIVGNRYWIGVALGSLLVNTNFASFDTTHILLFLKSFAIAFSIGIGAGIQAVVGVNLIRRFVGYPCTLGDEKEIARFFICALASCFVNSTWGSFTLLVSGNITFDSLLFSWLTWWVGDCLGVMVFTPLIMIWTAKPRDLWIRRKYTVGLPMTLLFTTAMVGFVYLSNWDQERIRSELQRKASTIGQTLQANLNNQTASLYSIRDLSSTEISIDRKNFQRFAKGLLSRYPGMQSFAWIEQVSLPNRMSFEKAMSDGHKNFQIREQLPNSGIVPATRRSEYFPITFIEPFKEYEHLLGIDVGSDITQWQILEKARQSGETTMTGKIPFLQSKNQNSETLLFLLPIYRSEDEKLRNSVRGYASGIFNVHALIETSLVGMENKDIGIRISDVSTKNPEVLYVSPGIAATLATSTASNASKKDPYESFRFDFYERKWNIDFFPSNNFLITHRSWQAWGGMVPILLLTSLVEIFLLAITGRAARVENLMMELTKSHRDLQQSEERFRLAVQGTHDGIWDWNPGHPREKVSPKLQIYSQFHGPCIQSAP